MKHNSCLHSTSENLVVLRYHNKANGYFSQLVEPLKLWVVFISIEKNNSVFKLSRTFWTYAYYMVAFIYYNLML